MDSALSLAAVAALGDRGEGVGAEHPDEPEHAGTLYWISLFIFAVERGPRENNIKCNYPKFRKSSESPFSRFQATVPVIPIQILPTSRPQRPRYVRSLSPSFFASCSFFMGIANQKFREARRKKRRLAAHPFANWVWHGMAMIWQAGITSGPEILRNFILDNPNLMKKASSK